MLSSKKCVCPFLEVFDLKNKRILANLLSNQSIKNVQKLINFSKKNYDEFLKANASHETVEAKIHQMNEKLTNVS